MPSTANTGAYTRQFDKELNKMVLESLTVPSEYEKVFKIEDAPRGSYYAEAQSTGLGPLQPVTEQGIVELDTFKEGNKVKRTWFELGLGFQVTQKMLEDELFDMAKKAADSLGRSARHSINLEAFKTLNLGDNGQLAWDGANIFANAHTTLKGGDTIDNLATAALTETSFQAAFEYFDALVTEEGFPTDEITGDLLLAPPKLRWIVNQLMRQRGQISSGSDTAEVSGNDMTTNPSNGYVNDWNAMLLKYLSAANGGHDDAWFFLNKSMHDFRIQFKRRVTPQKAYDAKTRSTLWMVTLRMVAFCNNYRYAYGSFPT
jgi:hypothetical protein